MEYGLIGEKLPHSFSKEIHGRIADYDYRLVELKPAEVPEFLRKREFRGVNVTIPYKQTVIPYLDEISPKARAIGAVNTIVNRNGRLLGYNTDYAGMEALLRHAGLSVSGKTVLILGTGGTSRTAQAVVSDLGAASVRRVSRTGRDGSLTYEQAEEEAAQIIVNTTPVGMFPHPDESPIDLSGFGWLEGVIDAVYNPLRTDLVQQARANGARGQGGLYMLTAQAVAAAQLFLGELQEDGLTDRIYRRIHGEKQNIVLTGMAGCGKSTVGRLLARETGRELVDTDEEIIRRTKKPIADLFAQQGEEAFRQLEEEVIAEVSQRTGLIIATGGGAVLREANVRRLRRNGRLYFLDRPVEELIPTADRPLSRTRAALEERWQQRYPRYVSTADAVIPVRDGPETVIDSIREEFVL